MGLDFERTGVSAVTGVVSGAVEKQFPKSVSLGGQAISYAGIAEAGLLVVGAVMQFVSPYTLPRVADGLVDGGAALVLRRAAVKLVPAGAAAMRSGGWYGAQQVGGRGAYGASAAPCAGARGSVGSVSRTGKRELS